MVDDDFEDDWDSEWDDRPPSKSAVKREMTALQDLGTRLTQLPEKQLLQINVEDPTLLEAIMLARRINARGGLRRQLQYIGKLMRHIDPEPIEEALAKIDGKHQEQNARFHRLEQLRDDLLAKGDPAIENIVSAYPSADRQQLRQWLRQHRAEVAQQKPLTSAKKVFRYLRELDDAEYGGDDLDIS